MRCVQNVDQLPDYSKVSFPPMLPLPRALLLPTSPPPARDFVFQLLCLCPAARLTALQVRSITILLLLLLLLFNVGSKYNDILLLLLLLFNAIVSSFAIVGAVAIAIDFAVTAASAVVSAASFCCCCCCCLLLLLLLVTVAAGGCCYC